jgi:hypothetical protein
MIDRDPESPEQMVIIGDPSRRHYDGRNRVVHDLLLRQARNAA